MVVYFDQWVSHHDVDDPQYNSDIAGDGKCFMVNIRTELFNIVMYHSYFSESMGLLRAARRVCQLMVNKAITDTLIPAAKNIHQERDVW